MTNDKSDKHHPGKSSRNFSNGVGKRPGRKEYPAKM